MSDIIIKNGDKKHKDRNNRATETSKVIANRSVRVKTISKKPIVHKVEVSNGTIPGRFLETAKKYPDNKALMFKKGHLFEEVTYKRLLNLVQNFTLSLEKFGVKKGDRVVIISENRPEWAAVDLAVKSLGAILAPMHKAFTIGQIKELVYDVEPALIIVSDAPTLFKIEDVNKLLAKNIPIVFLEVEGKNNNVKSKDGCDFISALQMVPHENHSETYQEKISKLKPEEVASILFTPSSDGKYMGVQLTHKNVVSNVISTKEVVEIKSTDSFLSVLPLSHAFEETAGYYVPLFSGAAINYLSDISEFASVVKRMQPTVIIGVPRLFEKSYQKILGGIKDKNLKEHLIKKNSNTNEYKGNIVNSLKEKIVNKKVKKSFGGKLRFLISGGAPLKYEVGKFFTDAGIPVLEGYGLTECSPIVSVNRLEDNKLGTVGRPLPSVTVKIADDGEVLLKGPSVTPGYFNAKASANGSWFHTGDYGELDEEGFLKLTGMKKDIIVLSTGKNVSPNAIEAQLSKSKYIKDSLIVGDGQKNISAIIFLEMNEIEKIFPYLDDKELVNDKDVSHFMQAEIDELLEDFSHYEQIKRFLLYKDHAQEVFGLRRQEAIKEFSNEISVLYKENRQSLLVSKF